MNAEHRSFGSITSPKEMDIYRSELGSEEKLIRENWIENENSSFQIKRSSRLHHFSRRKWTMGKMGLRKGQGQGRKDDGEKEER